MHHRPAPSLDGAEAWLLRADEHLGDLEAIIRPLLKAEREVMISSVGDSDAHPDPAVLGSLNLAEPTIVIPDRVSILLGEGVQALRRSLDYLIFELAWLDSGSRQDGTQFPLEDSDLRFWRRLHRVKGGPAAFLYGLKGEHAAVIERYQPYAGAHWPKLLRTISNPDKHRHLTLAKNERSVTLTAQKPLEGQARVKRLYNGFTAIMPISDAMQMKFEVTLVVALDDGTRVVDALNEIESGVNFALFQFAPCFKGKCPH